VFQNLPGIVVGQADQTFGQGGGRLTGVRAMAAPSIDPAASRTPAAFSVRSITVVDPNFETPTTHQWGVSLQREVMRRTILEVNYIGRRAHNLFGAYNVNQTLHLRNGFLEAVKVAAGGGDSALMNQIMGVDTRKQAAETGSQAFRRIYATEIRGFNAGAISQDLSRRAISGRGQAEVAGLGQYFFIPFPQFAGGISVIDSNDWSTYNALQVQLEKRLTNGLTWQAGYTWSKSLDTRSYDPAFTIVSGANNQSASSTPFDIYNRRLNYGLSDFDRTHALQSYWLYELPFGKGRQFGSNAGAVVNRLIGGWQFAGFLTVQTGRPLSVYSGYYTFNNVVQSFANCNGCTRADGAVDLNGPGGLVWYFDQAQIGKFSFPGWGEIGNTGRNFFRGPGGIGIDAALLKRTAITERINVEIRADAVNVTNSPIFGSPTATLSSTIFGRIRDSVSSASRKIQLGAKINF
jgi:hypothetical protein